MRAVRFTALVLGAGLLEAVLVAQPAVAQRYTEGDPAGDMVVTKLFGKDKGDFAVAANHRHFDIRRVFVRHTPRVVIIRTVLRALVRPRDKERLGLGGYINVDRHARPSESEGWRWDVYFNKNYPINGLRLSVANASYNEEVSCWGKADGLHAVAHYEGNWVTMTIPRRCLGYGSEPLPRWVRVSVYSSDYMREGDFPTYWDRLRAQTPDPWPDPAKPHFTPRLYAG
jgi:hypothetical protein